jgi:peptidoglycan/LPS O-acetylase OafA/YrhL
VILFHAEIPGFGGGFIGVDVFFVISGYLITGLISREVEEKSFSLSRFYERRVRRILPALFLVVLVTLVAGWFYLMPLEFDLLGRSAVATVLSVSNFYFWSDTGYFSVTAEAKPLLHTWSLSVEEQFYPELFTSALIVGWRM